jgi:hypothetical protein
MVVQNFYARGPNSVNVRRQITDLILTYGLSDRAMLNRVSNDYFPKSEKFLNNCMGFMAKLDNPYNITYLSIDFNTANRRLSTDFQVRSHILPYGFGNIVQPFFFMNEKNRP